MTFMRRLTRNEQSTTIVEFAIVFSMIAVAGIFSVKAASGKVAWMIGSLFVG